MPKEVLITYDPTLEEYRVHLRGATPFSGYYTTDKADAEGTARAEHGADAVIKHRRLRRPH